LATRPGLSQLPMPTITTMAAYIKKLLKKAAESHPRISGQPTDDDIFKMTKVLYPILHNANYDMITVAGQVNHDLTGLIQHDVSYTATWTAPFPRPVRPAPYDPNIPNAATPVVRNRMEAAHATVVSDFKTYTAAKKRVSAFIQAVVDEMWIKPLHHLITFYNNVTAYDLLEYLRTNSGGLHNTDLATLPTEMLHYYANKDSIPKFILALKKAHEKLARGGIPMSDATLLATAHLQVFTSLHYLEATREWERLPPALQTWAAWQTNYREANVKRLRLLCAKPNSFGAANNVTDTQITSDAIATALDNITNSATNNSTLMSNMLAQLAALTTHLDGMQQYHGVVTPPANPSSGAIFKSGISRKMYTHTGVPANPTTPPPPALTTTPCVPKVYTQAQAICIFDPAGYSGTHGYRVVALHTSKTCKKKGPHHNVNVTRADTKWGSKTNKGWETNPNPM
jgi:hypothetical protein